MIMKKLKCMAALICMLLICTLPAAAADQTVLPKIVDQAECLSENEEAELSQRAEALAGQFQMDVVIVTALERREADAQAEADALFDQGGYGIGEEKDGILLLVNLGQGEWSISTHGKAITVFTDTSIQSMGEELAGTYLRNAQYAAGFQAYLQDVETILTAYEKTGNNVESETETNESPRPEKTPDTQGSAVPEVQTQNKAEPEEAKTPLDYVLPALIGALVLTVIYMAALKQEMKAVGKQKDAGSYQSGGAAEVKKKEVFLTSSITKKRIEKEQPQENNRDHDRRERERRERERRERERKAERNRSTTHISKNGEKHGGGSGKF